LLIVICIKIQQKLMQYYVDWQNYGVQLSNKIIIYQYVEKLFQHGIEGIISLYQSDFASYIEKQFNYFANKSRKLNAAA